MAKRRRPSNWEGFINLHKDPGMTSHDCIAVLRRLLGERRIGHGGTLDPAATGVLPVAVGGMTRLLRFLESDKAYRATVRLGTATDTDDLEGAVLEVQDTSTVSFEAVQAKLSHFQGTLVQTPPHYSAIRQGGRRLYELARSGEAPDLADIPSRTVQVFRLAVVAWQPGPAAEVTFEVDCSAGTYIRSIARDLGVALGCGATLARLVRTRSGQLALEDSLTLDTVGERLQAGRLALVGPAEALAHLSVVQLDEVDAGRWRQGQKVPGTTGSEYAQVWSAGHFLGVASSEAGQLQPLVVLGGVS